MSTPKILKVPNMQRRKPTYSIPVMSPLESGIFKSLVFIWLAVLLWFWSWWLQSGHVATVFGMFISSLLVMFVTVMPGYFFFFAAQMRRPNPENKLPGGPVRFVLTKAPSESFSIVIKPTLLALIAMRAYAHSIGVAAEIVLCDEDPGIDTDKSFLRQHRIMLETRKGQAIFHQPGFQGGTKRKEGNVFYMLCRMVSKALIRLGHSDIAEEVMKGDLSVAIHYIRPMIECGYLPSFMFFFDADHRPEPEYIYEMLLAFADPRVGYVAAPSICVGDSWIARARLFVEATLHGPLQAGYYAHFAPSCIGSHYAVRTFALLTVKHAIPLDGVMTIITHRIKWVVGGMTAELAEDFGMGFSLHAAEWRGAFSIFSIAIGDGPESLADGLTQEFQWSRSLMNWLLKWRIGYWRTIPLRLKGQFLFALTWYPLFALHMLVGTFLPLIALLTKTPWLNMSYAEFLAHSIPLTIACILPVAFLRYLKVLRPADAKLMSWETVVFQFVRWPWVLYGVVHGFIGTVILNKDLPFKVTPKGVKGAQPLPLKVVFPYALISLINLGATLLITNPGAARGYYYFTLVNGLVYLGILGTIIFQHLRENREKEGYSVNIAWKPIAVAVLVFMLCSAAVVVRGPSAVSSIFGIRLGAPTQLLGQPQIANVPTQGAPQNDVAVPVWGLGNDQDPNGR